MQMLLIHKMQSNGIQNAIKTYIISEKKFSVMQRKKLRTWYVFTHDIAGRWVSARLSIPLDFPWYYLNLDLD